MTRCAATAVYGLSRVQKFPMEGRFPILPADFRPMRDNIVHETADSTSQRWFFFRKTFSAFQIIFPETFSTKRCRANGVKELVWSYYGVLREAFLSRCSYTGVLKQQRNTNEFPISSSMSNRGIRFFFLLSPITICRMNVDILFVLYWFKHGSRLTNST